MMFKFICWVMLLCLIIKVFPWWLVTLFVAWVVVSKLISMPVHSESIDYCAGGQGRTLKSHPGFEYHYFDQVGEAVWEEFDLDTEDGVEEAYDFGILDKDGRVTQKWLKK